MRDLIALIVIYMPKDNFCFQRMIFEFIHHQWFGVIGGERRHQSHRIKKKKKAWSYSTFLNFNFYVALVSWPAFLMKFKFHFFYIRMHLVLMLAPCKPWMSCLWNRLLGVFKPSCRTALTIHKLLLITWLYYTDLFFAWLRWSCRPDEMNGFKWTHQTES